MHEDLRIVFNISVNEYSYKISYDVEWRLELFLKF
jgi:hypothetical protein